MNISEFARSRGAEPQTVRHYINSHPDIKIHTRKTGKETELTDEAIELLDKVYPLPRPVQLMNGIDPEEHKAALDKLAKTQEYIIQLQEKMMEDQKLIAQAEAQKILLEDKETQLEAARSEGEKKDHQLEDDKKKIDEQTNKKEIKPEKSTQIKMQLRQ